jgi:uncharacterized membrane protein
MPALLTVTLYTRRDCHLCEATLQDLASISDEFPHRVVEIDVDTDPVLIQRFGERVPVLEAGPYRLEAPISLQALRMTLGAANDRRNQLEQVGDPTYGARLRKGRTVTGGDRLSFWIARHYLAVLNLFMLFYVGLPFLAPVLMNTGHPGGARLLYRMYSPLCHQFGFRSLFLFGEQPFYPLAEAGLPGVLTFDRATGIQGADSPTSPSRLEARAYVGNTEVGYKVALCERDVAIYAALLLFGILFAVTGRKLNSVHWLVWIMLGIAPIAVDGFSQLVSQFEWPLVAQILPYRESTPQLRLLTGFVFGFLTAWFAYPSMEVSMLETRQFLLKKFAVNRADP